MVGLAERSARSADGLDHGYAIHYLMSDGKVARAKTFLSWEEAFKAHGTAGAIKDGRWRRAAATPFARGHGYRSRDRFLGRRPPPAL
jgi:hypothetical protein